MNPKSYGYTPRPVEVTRVLMSKEDKARYELEQGEAEMVRLKDLRSVQVEKVMRLRKELSEAEYGAREAAMGIQKQIERNLQLETFLKLAEEI